MANHVEPALYQHDWEQKQIRFHGTPRMDRRCSQHRYTALASHPAKMAYPAKARSQSIGRGKPADSDDDPGACIRTTRVRVVPLRLQPRRHALGDHLLGDIEIAGDLLRCEPGAFHGGVPGPDWAIGDSHSPWSISRFHISNTGNWRAEAWSQPNAALPSLSWMGDRPCRLSAARVWESDLRESRLHHPHRARLPRSPPRGSAISPPTVGNPAHNTGRMRRKA